MEPPRWKRSRRFVARLRWFRWRGAVLVLVFACGLGGFLSGVDVSDRAGVSGASLATQVYYALGLFVLGGMDLGVPTGGPLFGRVLLWLAYFGAPAVTASALVEGVIRAVNPEAWRLRQLRGHVIVAGGGRLGMMYLRRLRDTDPTTPVLLVDRRPDHETEQEAREVYGAELLTADISSDGVLRSLGLGRAARVMLLTGDDIANLDAAASILEIAPELASHIVVHVSDIRMMRVMRDTRLAHECEVFNTYQIAARHLVQSELAARFERTPGKDTVVLAGFGRFGQTLLDELQTSAADQIDELIVVDLEGQARAADFQAQVGFSESYPRTVIDADLTSQAAWDDLEARCNVHERAPVFILCSGDDGTNVRSALALSAKFPDAFVVARTFRRSAFAARASTECGFRTVSVSELLLESMPSRWLA